VGEEERVVPTRSFAEASPYLVDVSGANIAFGHENKPGVFDSEQRSLPDASRYVPKSSDGWNDRLPAVAPSYGVSAYARLCHGATAMTLPAPAEIVAFWREAGPDKWFAQDASFDAAIRSRFLAACEAAANGALSAWEAGAQGALALLLLLDQFPRNMFRGSARAFAADALARAVADRALARGFDRATEPALRPFFYLPFMHSEMPADQDRCVRLYEVLGDAELLGHAREHRDVVRRFGRFPHRNRALGRATTPAEQAFLDAEDSAGPGAVPDPA
jgi:uncharacterized protein (DUF924 family)